MNEQWTLNYDPGLWYRAARYDTYEEAALFGQKLNAELEKHVPGENLITMSFENPNKHILVLTIGYPDERAKMVVESLYERPPEPLRDGDIEYALRQVRELRREEGMSDIDAAEWAANRMLESGMPGTYMQRIMQDYLHATEDENGDYRVPVPALDRQRPTDEEFSMYKNKPFIVFFRDMQCRDLERLKDHGPYPYLKGTEIATEGTKYTINRKIKDADKYQFDLSAQAMLEAVRDPAQTSWLRRENHLWIEFQEPISNEYSADEAIKAIWVNDAYAARYINELVAKADNPDVYNAMLARNILYMNYWSMDIVTADCYELFDYTYDIHKEEFVYLASHKCPWRQCEYPLKEGEGHLGLCVPCEHCLSALDYWSSVLHTAIRQIQREYALVPEEPAPLKSRIESYSEEVIANVGKGKNKRKLKQTVKREVEYRVVSYEVSEISGESRQRARDLIAEEQSRGNWLTVHDPFAIAWEYKAIDVSRGRVLDPERNPRWKRKQHINIVPFKKWVPMLKEKRTIKRVKARRFAKKETQQ